jgi:hypothetical protein
MDKKFSIDEHGTVSTPTGRWGPEGFAVTVQEPLQHSFLEVKVFCVKIEYDDEVKRIRGTSANEESGPGTLVVYDGPTVVARLNKVDRWWTESSPAKAGGT